MVIKRWLSVGASLAVIFLVVAVAAGCETGPSPREVAAIATAEALRDELKLLREQGSQSQTSTPQSVAAMETPTLSASPRISTTIDLDSRLLDWRAVEGKAQVADLELSVHSLLLGQENYGGPYGSSISAKPGTKIVLADVTLRYEFRPGSSPYEIRVDFFGIADSAGLEYRALPVPRSHALPDRFFLSPGQAYRGVLAFIVPQDLKDGTLYFTNMLGGQDPPERLTIYLNEIP